MHLDVSEILLFKIWIILIYVQIIRSWLRLNPLLKALWIHLFWREIRIHAMLIYISSYDFLYHFLNNILCIFVVEFILKLLNALLKGNSRCLLTTNQILCILGPFLPQLLFFLGNFWRHIVFLRVRIICILLCLVLNLIFEFVFNTCFGRSSRWGAHIVPVDHCSNRFPSVCKYFVSEL